jgi:hypothetical protein
MSSIAIPVVRAVGITAKIASLDEPGLIVIMSRASFIRPPSICERRFGSNWNRAGVSQASPQFLEYFDTNPEIRIYHIFMDAYNRPGGVANNLEAEISKLKRLTERAPGKVHGHRCVWTQGAQPPLRCYVRDVYVPVELVASDAGAMIAREATIELEEIRR